MPGHSSLRTTAHLLVQFLSISFAAVISASNLLAQQFDLNRNGQGEIYVLSRPNSSQTILAQFDTAGTLLNSIEIPGSKGSDIFPASFNGDFNAAVVRVRKSERVVLEVLDRDGATLGTFELAARITNKRLSFLSFDFDANGYTDIALIDSSGGVKILLNPLSAGAAISRELDFSIGKYSYVLPGVLDGTIGLVSYRGKKQRRNRKVKAKKSAGTITFYSLSGERLFVRKSRKISGIPRHASLGASSGLLIPGKDNPRKTTGTIVELRSGKTALKYSVRPGNLDVVASDFAGTGTTQILLGDQFANFSISGPGVTTITGLLQGTVVADPGDGGNPNPVRSGEVQALIDELEEEVRKIFRSSLSNQTPDLRRYNEISSQLLQYMTQEELDQLLQDIFDKVGSRASLRAGVETGSRTIPLSQLSFVGPNQVRIITKGKGGTTGGVCSLFLSTSRNGFLAKNSDVDDSRGGKIVILLRESIKDPVLMNPSLTKVVAKLRDNGPSNGRFHTLYGPRPLQSYRDGTTLVVKERFSANSDDSRTFCWRLTGTRKGRIE